MTLDCTLELWWRICSNSLSLSISFMASEREDWCGKGGSHTPDNFYVSVWGSKEVRGNTPLSRYHTYMHMSARICNIRVLLLIFLWEPAFVTPVAVTEKIIRGFCRKLQEQASCLDAVHNWTGYAFESFMILWSVNLRASHLGLNSVWCSSQIISSTILKCALIVRWKMFCSAQMSDTKFRIVGGL